MKKILLRPGREKSVLQRHPWIFSGAVEEVAGSPEPGDTVQVCTALGSPLGWAAYSPASQIRARMWSWEPEEIVGPEFLFERVRKAINRRKLLPILPETDAVRLVHGESDGLPGLVVDRYADTLVMQLLSAGPERWRAELASALTDLTGLDTVYERSDVDVRKLEGLDERTGLICGSEPPERIAIYEGELRFLVDVRAGHKTGFYLDQRSNRAALQEWATGRDVLNCFSYTGGFSLHALQAGASSVLSVDTSADALAMGEQHVQINSIPTDRATWLEGDVFQVLRLFRDQGRSFDLIVLDPPKFAPTAAQAERAARGYKDINLLAFKLLRPGGVLFTFSCSGGVSLDLFQKIVAGAALDAGVDAQMLRTMTQGSDHPVALNFPEGAYLKGLVCRV